MDRPKRLALSYGLGCMDMDHNHVISLEAARGMQECHGGCVPCVRMRKLRNGQFKHLLTKIYRQRSVLSKAILST